MKIIPILCKNAGKIFMFKTKCISATLGNKYKNLISGKVFENNIINMIF